jgi:8-oxo-dGTP diphosphatase
MSGRFRVTPAVYLFLVRGDRLLLARRAGGWGDGNWSVPAGHLEGDESAVDAVAREALEEIGVSLDPASLRLVHTMHRRDPMNRDNERIDLFFEAEAGVVAPENREPDRCSAIAWFATDDWPDPHLGYVREAWRLSRRGVAFSDDGWDERHFA